MLPFMAQPAVAAACYVPRKVMAQSLNMRGAADPALYRVQGAAGNLRKWTAVFRTAADQGALLSSALPGTNTQYTHIALNGGSLTLNTYTTTDVIWLSSADKLRANGFFRTLVVHYDSDNATAADRVRFYCNRRRLAIASGAILPSLGDESCHINQARRQNVGMGYKTPLTADAWYHNGPLGEVFFFDGINLDPALFDEANIHGVAVPVDPAVTLADYGVNGFRLDFSDSAQPGKDVSGKANHYTAANIAITDVVASTPTNVYATLNPLASGIDGAFTLSDGNLSVASTTQPTALGTLKVPDTGKTYFEATYSSGVTVYVGINHPVTNVRTAACSNGSIYVDGVQTQGGLTPWSSGDVIGIAVDGGARLIQFYRNAAPYGAAVTYTSSLDLYPFLRVGTNSTSAAKVNFGQRAWAYPAPIGFKPLCTDNLHEPDTKDPAEALAQASATGANILAVLDASTAHWNGQWVEIIKRRDAIESWRWRFFDDPGNALASDTTAAGKVAAPALIAGGAYFGTRLRVGRKYGVYAAEVAHVTGTATTVNHNLGTTRNALIVRRADAGGEWWQHHPDYPAGQLAKFSAPIPAASTVLANFGANSFDIGATMPTGTYRVLVLAKVPGLLDMGQYQGVAQVDGPFVPVDVSPELWWQFGTTSGISPRLMSRALCPANPITSELMLSINVVESTWSATATPAYNVNIPDLVVGGMKARGYGGGTNDPTTFYFLTIGRPIGGVCVAPATAR